MKTRGIIDGKLISRIAWEVHDDHGWDKDGSWSVSTSPYVGARPVVGGVQHPRRSDIGKRFGRTRRDVDVLGGRGRRRPTSYVRVKDPAVGFFVAGSSEEGLNGLYGRTDKAPPGASASDVEISYRHLDTGWFMALRRQRTGDPEWVFVDPTGHERLVNSEYTLIPGSGQKWRHAPAKGKSGWFSRFGRRGNGDGGEGEKGGEGGDREGSKKPNTDETRVEASKAATTDTYHELPWQLIAIMGEDMLKQLAGHKRYHDGLVRAALNCKPPDPEPGFRGSLDLVPPPESVEAASTPDADVALEDGELEEAAAKVRRRAGQTAPLRGRGRARRLDTSRARAETRAGTSKVESVGRRRATDRRSSRVPPQVRRHAVRVGFTLAGQGRTDRGDGGFPGPRVCRSLVRGAAGVARADARAREAGVHLGRREEENRRGEGWRTASTEPHLARRDQVLRRLEANGGCDPVNGAREPEKDLPCVEPVSAGSSGVCECAAPSTLLDLIESALAHSFAREHIDRSAAARVNATRASPMTCSHDGGVKCAVECEQTRGETDSRTWWSGPNGWRLRPVRPTTRRMAPRTATGAMRTALDRMRRWERGEAVDDAVDANEDARANVLRDFLNRARSGSDALQQAASFATSSDGWSDHYAVLSLPSDFTESELRGSYRRISLRVHPKDGERLDKPGGSMVDFQRVAEAYTVLSDDAKRASFAHGTRARTSRTKPWTAS